MGRYVKIRIRTLLVLAYLIAGLVVAGYHDYFSNVDSVERLFSAVLAVLFWWMIPLGIDLHINV